MSYVCLAVQPVLNALGNIAYVAQLRVVVVDGAVVSRLRETPGHSPDSENLRRSSWRKEPSSEPKIPKKSWSAFGTNPRTL